MSPTPSRSAQFVRFEKTTKLRAALAKLESKNVVKNAWVAEMYARVTKKARDVNAGTYKVQAGTTVDQVLSSLRSPVKQMVRLPEGWWMARFAARLQDEGVCKADEYLEAAKNSTDYRDVGFDLPTGSLEGWLFPDTYDLPPLTLPSEVVRLQLRTFKRKALPLFSNSQNVRRTLTIASMVELEAAKDTERARIAGVIENRLRKGIPLQIDATVLYALQEWKQLAPNVVRTVQSPYNTYLNKGLPPGPIGSPGLKSIRAALKPEAHGYLYYVARPDRSHYFASTYPEHLKNIRRARAEWRATGQP